MDNRQTKTGARLSFFCFCHHYRNAPKKERKKTRHFFLSSRFICWQTKKKKKKKETELVACFFMARYDKGVPLCSLSIYKNEREGKKKCEGVYVPVRSYRPARPWCPPGHATVVIIKAFTVTMWGPALPAAFFVRSLFLFQLFILLCIRSRIYDDESRSCFVPADRALVLRHHELMDREIKKKYMASFSFLSNSTLLFLEIFLLIVLIRW